MNDIIEEDEFQESPSPPPPAEKRAEAPRRKEKKWYAKFLVISGVTVLVGLVFILLHVLSPLVGAAAVLAQVVSMAVYFASSHAAQVAEQKHLRDVLGPKLRARRRRAGIRFVTMVMVGFLGFALFQHYGVLAYPPPWKVTDPSSRLFNPAKFSFSDYRTPAEIDRAARILFPLHTTKAAVDQVLLGAGHATAKLYDQGISSKVYCYVYSSGSARSFITGVFAWVLDNHEAQKLWFVFVRYDPAGKVTGVSGTVDYDETGTLSYDGLTPSGTTEPLRRLP